MAKLTSDRSYRAYLMMELLRSTGEREFPMQLASIFFWIGSHNGCKQEDLQKAVGISASSVSRCVTWLGPRHRLEHRPGLKLVRRERDPDNYKAWRLYLTPKGKQFVNLLEHTVDMPLPKVVDSVNHTRESFAYDDDEDLG